VQTPEILFEDALILAVNKPSGIPSHNLPGQTDLNRAKEATMESILLNLRGSDSIFLLHRLDTGTSGVLLFAKDSKTYNAMREKFKLKEIKKKYRAWSDSLAAFSGPLPIEINHPLAHHPKSKKRMVVIEPERKISYRGNPIAAHSIIHSAKQTQWMGKPATELQVEIITGVMHQIRAHLKYAKYPLIGDSIYNRVGETEVEECTSMRLGLHAETIEFELNGFHYLIEAPAPR
jgi:23S rRNA pseudouridine1911/1915/1917 synthase